jgi:NADPH-dependent ferric siderophore reductase
MPRRVAVRAVQHLSPRMRRVTFGGEDLAGFSWSGPAAHLKLLFPPPGETEVVAPTPDGPRPTTMRTYTPRRVDAAAQTLDVDFVLHGEGPASSWAEQARVGQELILMGPAPGYRVDPDAPWYVLVGDDTALPAIETLLEAAPTRSAVTAFIEVVAADEVRPLPRAAQADLRWLPRGADPRQAGTALQAALAAFRWPAGEGRIYIGCEAQAMRRIHSQVIEASGLARQRVTGRGYWQIGAVNHPDRDFVDD